MDPEDEEARPGPVRRIAGVVGVALLVALGLSFFGLCLAGVAHP